MKKYIYLVLVALTLVFFPFIQLGLLRLGFSWTLSFAFPYFLLFLLGLAVALSLKSSFRRYPKALRYLLFPVLFASPFALGFAIHPIYEGDYAKTGEKLSGKINFPNEGETDLVVLTIPRCPFCRESTFRINRLQRRNPQMKIKYLVCSTDPDAVDELRKDLDPQIQIGLVQNLQEAIDLAEGRFPSFIKTEGERATYKWNNMQLGYRALDWIESGAN